MGAMTPPGGPADDSNCSATSKPKERQFQVVPVPGVFTRGRWKCCDFREAQLADQGILEFAKPGADAANHDASTIMVTSVAPAHLQALQKQTQSTPVSATHIPVDDSLDSSRSEQASSTLTASSRADTTTDSMGSPQPASMNTELTVPPAEIPRHGSSATVNIPITSRLDTDETTDSAALHTGAQAIDSKIEQAMDLVKSHLTFAVREEVEDLRTTISQLKNKVSLLENQNSILRQYAPPDIVANLPALMQSQQIPPLSSQKSETVTERPPRTLTQAPPSEADEAPQPVPQHPPLLLPAVATINKEASSASLPPPTPPAASFPSMGIYEPQPQPLLPQQPIESGQSTPTDPNQRGSSMAPTPTPRQFSPPVVGQNAPGITRQYSVPDPAAQRQFSPPVQDQRPLPPQLPQAYNTPLLPEPPQSAPPASNANIPPQQLQTIPVIVDPPTPTPTITGAMGHPGGMQ